eukprot:1405722-Amphidinium_carterae.2
MGGRLLINSIHRPSTISSCVIDPRALFQCMLCISSPAGGHVVHVDAWDTSCSVNAHDPQTLQQRKRTVLTVSSNCVHLLRFAELRVTWQEPLGLELSHRKPHNDVTVKCL